MRHTPIYGGHGRMHWARCTGCTYQSAAYMSSADAAAAFAQHADRQVSVSGDPTLAALLRQVATQ